MKILVVPGLVGGASKLPGNASTATRACGTSSFKVDIHSIIVCPHQRKPPLGYGVLHRLQAFAALASTISLHDSKLTLSSFYYLRSFKDLYSWPGSSVSSILRWPLAPPASGATMLYIPTSEEFSTHEPGTPLDHRIYICPALGYYCRIWCSPCLPCSTQIVSSSSSSSPSLVSVADTSKVLGMRDKLWRGLRYGIVLYWTLHSRPEAYPDTRGFYRG
ncbi:hypothetical protein BDM02DRAFT_605919 [Thelephora ganbajun]|uniref:Uncharacterized protein n=1 Tax=Thelephora ganbajun TaxID=370292 RepID=A0ACB6Z7K8_THEGA|nr:hypothetical protein BDM02DRAFT_605919 [Thelephora ganbajun]